MSDSLFIKKYEPLAVKLRPEDFETIEGQKKVLTQIQSLNNPISIILYGPPGTGKTSISHLLCKKWNLQYRKLNATTAGVKEIKELSMEAKKLGNIVLFIDEIHRFSSSQQDSLLSSVESGEFILIGATTENPAFRINRPLLSRLQIYKLDILDFDSLNKILEKAVLHLEMKIELDAKKNIIQSSGGDARKLLTYLESMYSIDSKKIWTQLDIENFLSNQIFTYDKNKENHYDFISAFIKSIRGSDPDAAIYYLACMLEGGEDPIFIIRRLVILASEDIGTASVNALTIAVNALHAIEKIGMPEARIILAHVTTFLASSPKSNSSYMALENAIQYVNKNGTSVQIPNHLRNAPTFIHRQEGASKNYIYPHNEPNHFILENYFPDELKNNPPQFYFPSEEGFDKNIKERLEKIWKNKKKY